MGKAGKGTGSFGAFPRKPGPLRAKGQKVHEFQAEPEASWSLAGKRHTKTHTLCRRCGRRSFHIQKARCSSCSYPAKSMRKCELFQLCSAQYRSATIMQAVQSAGRYGSLMKMAGFSCHHWHCFFSVMLQGCRHHDPGHWF